jgi:hypothetical protein
MADYMIPFRSIVQYVLSKNANTSKMYYHIKSALESAIDISAVKSRNKGRIWSELERTASQLPDPIGSTGGVGVGPERALSEEAPCMLVISIADIKNVHRMTFVFCD